jgi:hypothetical protein
MKVAAYYVAGMVLAELLGAAEGRVVPHGDGPLMFVAEHDPPVIRRDGRWNVTMETDLPGVRQNPPPMKFAQCVTKEDAKDPARLVPLSGRQQPPPESAPNCQISDQKIEGGKVSWKTYCAGEFPVAGIGEFLYSVDRYVGTMKVTTKRDGQPYTVTMSYSAIRVGDCTQ